MARDLQTCGAYYGSRLAIQYRGQPKAQATIQLLTKQAMGDLMIQDVQDAWDLATAVGPQLDTVGKYIGLSRNVSVTLTRPYFGFVLYAGGGNTNGFQGYGPGYVLIGVEGYDPLTGYTNGTITSLNSGYNWGGNGTLTVPDITCQDDLTSYSVGTITALNGGTGWGADGSLVVPN
jgi:hypothetical protein